MEELDRLRAKQAQAEQDAEGQVDPALKETMENIAAGWKDLADDLERNQNRKSA